MDLRPYKPLIFLDRFTAADAARLANQKPKVAHLHLAFFITPN